LEGGEAAVDVAEAMVGDGRDVCAT